MIVRRSLAGLIAIVAACAALGSARLGAATVPATAPKPTVSASPVPLVATPAVPLPAASGLHMIAPFPASGAVPAQSYATFIKGADHEPGVLDLVRKDDDLYLDLRPENFDTPYIILPSIASGVGGEAFAGRVYDPLVVIFKRVGKRVMWITPNTRYVADKGTSAAASLAVSVADSVIQSSPIVAEDTDKTHTVINPAIFLTDFEGIGTDLGRSAAPPPSLPGLLVLTVRPSFGVDSTKSYYLATKAFPRNDEISVNLTFSGPANALPTVPDGRGIPIVVHYSIVAPPAHDPSYVPRYADDRVGYFITARKHYGSDVSDPPTQRFIDRWNLAAGPIVFTLTNEIPPQYRATVRSAILAWNVAFAKLGYPNAIEVNDPPADPHFDPDDARYNSVRWLTSDSSEFVAISAHVSDPDTGQIIRATVAIDGEAMRTVHLGYVDRALPVQRNRDAFAAPAPPDPNASIDDLDEPRDAQSCEFAEGSANQAALGMSMLAANPRVAPAERERYAQAYLYATVMHEVGHTLGLRHNFRGSTAFTYAQLRDPAFTRLHGTTGSVMDYTPANIAPDGERQASYFPDRIGPYDIWAIQYGYTRVHADTSDGELPALRAIAARSTEPGLAYATDEDATDPFSIDPRDQRFDLSDDPLRYAQAQFAIDDQIARTLLHRYPGDTRTYQDLRQTFVSVLNNEIGAAFIASRSIGGIYTSRAHRGQPGATAPFREIPRAQQRRAFELIDRYILSSRALRYPPQLLNDVAPMRFGGDWSSKGVRRIDFPIREAVAEIQDDEIAELFSPAVMERIADQALKQTKPHQTMDLADLFGWTNAAIYDDLGAATIAPLHRDLQRRFVDLEIEIAFLPSGVMDQLSLPRDIQALARYELRWIRGRLDGAEHHATDVASRAHIDDLRSRIDSALQPGAIRPL